jgi:hypothetical protein
MTAPRDCRPPENAPDGMVFILHHDNAPRGMLHMWHADGWWRRTGSIIRARPEMMADAGWTIAEPPHE